MITRRDTPSSFTTVFTDTCNRIHRQIRPVKYGLSSPPSRPPRLPRGSNGGHPVGKATGPLSSAPGASWQPPPPGVPRLHPGEYTAWRLAWSRWRLTRPLGRSGWGWCGAPALPRAVRWPANVVTFQKLQSRSETVEGLPNGGPYSI